MDILDQVLEVFGYAGTYYQHIEGKMHHHRMKYRLLATLHRYKNEQVALDQQLFHY